MFYVREIKKLETCWKKLNLPDSARDYLDMEYSVLVNGLTIDMFKFDEMLHRKFGMYENDKKSMKDVVIENYGREAANLIEELL